MRELTPDEAKELICQIAEDGFVNFSPHARARMEERGYSDADVLYILETGEVLSTELDTGGRYRYHVHGLDLDEHPGAVIVTIINQSRMIVVTVKGGM